jgi:hypothetical protein
MTSTSSVLAFMRECSNTERQKCGCRLPGWIRVPSEPEPASRARLEPQRYKVQFEASEGYVELVEKAKALLSQTAPRVDLGELHLRAMRALVTELERKKYAAARPRQRVAPAATTQSATPSVSEPAPRDGAPRAPSQVPFARGGEHRLDNLTLRCRVHNPLAAEQDFGRDFVALARDSSQHETWAAYEAVPCATPARTGAC